MPQWTRNRPAAISFVFFCAFWLQAPQQVALAAADLEADRIDAILAKAYPDGQPGAAVIVTKDGKTVFRKAYGMANLELGVPLQPDMVFRLGSITKQFTAAAILLLEQRGELSVEDPITKHLPDYPVHGHRITVEHLLTHTSGIFNYTAIPGYMAEKVRQDLSTDELVEAFKDQPMNFAPGERWSYSNSGYVLLGAIIEKVSGQSYADFVQKNIFEPLGMKQSYYGGHQIIPKRVAGYQGAPGSYRNADYLSMTQPHAAGSLLSTVDDLARWDQALYSDELLSRETFGRMTTPFTLNSGEKTTYGYGFQVGDVRGQRVIRHGGGIFGFRTDAIRIPDQKIYLAVLTNSTGPQPGPGFAATKIAAVALGDPFPEWKAVEVDSQVLSRYLGVYKISDDEQRILTLDNGRLFTQRGSGNRLEAVPASETTFFYRNSLSYFEIERDAQGNATAMLMHQNGSKQAERSERVSDKPPLREAVQVDPGLYDAYQGVYQLAPGFSLTITHDGDRLLAQATGQPQVEIFPESETKFFLKVVNAQITFVREGGGPAEELILHQGGRDMPGKRVK